MKNICLLILFVYSLVSCNKSESGSATAGQLMKSDWYLYNIQQISFDSTTSGWQLRKDTSYTVDICLQQSRYHFFANGVFKYDIKCNNLTTSPGKWSLKPGDYLSASAVVNEYGPTYLVGINECRIVEINEHQFKTTSSITSYPPTPGIYKDSLTTIRTYKN